MTVQKKHQEHIVCIKAEKVKHREHNLAEYELNLADLMLGQRAALEKDDDFRQVLPISIFTHKGKIWTYERTPKGGEERLHNKTAIAVGGHWDIADLVIVDGVIDLGESLDQAAKREIAEEVVLTSKVVDTHTLPLMVCADATEVDRMHVALVWIHELDGEGLDSGEEDLKSIGFLTLDELLNTGRDNETWTSVIGGVLAERELLN